MNKREEVLKMVKEGLLTVEEAVKLLDAMEENASSAIVSSLTLPPDYSKKMLRILIDGANGDNVKVNIPVALVMAGLDIAKKVGNVNYDGKKVDLKQIDFDLISECIQSGMLGEIVNIETSDGDLIRIVIE